MTRHLLWILLLVTIAFLPASAATLWLTAPAGSVPVGSSFWVDVNVSTAGTEDIWAYQFSVQFDPAVLQFLGAQDGTFLPPASLALDPLLWNYTPGSNVVTEIANSLSGGVPGVSGAGVLAQLQFQALSPSSSTPISPYDTILLDAGVNQLGGVAENGTTVTVDPAVVPEPATLGATVLVLAALVVRGRKHRHP